MSRKESALAADTTANSEILRILNENNRMWRENNQLMKDIREMLRKIAINAS